MDLHDHSTVLVADSPERFLDLRASQDSFCRILGLDR
jgi:hypothetical protein